jgi:diguanylate cyclase (GGDEF)-like protein/PAS domain S-box-containing protein
MTAGGPGPDEVNALLEDRLAVAEETLRALRAGEVDAIVMDSGQGEQRVYALETQDRPYRLLVERMSEGAAIVDADGLISYANQQLATLLGVPLERLVGRPFSAWLEEPDRSRLIGQLTAAASGGDDEYTLRRLDGDSVAVRVGVSVADEPDGLVRCITVTDLSDQKARQREVSRLNAELTGRLAELREINTHLKVAQHLLTHRNLHDPLTGLPNRTLFLDRLDQSLADAVRTGYPRAVYFIDLDGFKRINDTLGYNAGDQILREVANRLSSVVRPGDTVARSAADEFLVVTAGTTGGPPVAVALAMADRIMGSLLHPPLQARGEPVTASMGLTLSREGARPEQLIYEADAAMQRAKRAGRARWEVFGPELRNELRRQNTSEKRLRQALGSDGVRVLYQPIVDLNDGRAVGAEALVRLRRRNGSLLSPSMFIARAEESGLVVPLGRQVLEHACSQPLFWQARTGHPWFVSVNVSPRELVESDIVAEVTATLAAASLPGDQLHLEINELALLDIGPSVLDTLEQLHEMGVRIGVDDFGTGYASMSYVRRLPLDFIKIDQSFVSGVHDDLYDLAMVEATLALSHRLGLQSIAEGIETEAQRERLRDLGCEQGQGFLFAKPTTSELFCPDGAFPGEAS